MVEHKDELTLLEERMQKPELCQAHCSFPLSTETVEVRQCSTSPICRVEWVLLKDATPCTQPPVAIGYVTVA